MPFPPSFDHVWDLTQPPDTQLASLGAQDFRNLKDDVMQRLSLLSGTLANRPTPETVNATWGGSGFGLLYFATDTGQTFQWSGSAWVDITLLLFGISSGSAFGIARVVASVNLANQTAGLVNAPLYTTSSSNAGLYRVSVHLTITQVGTGGNISVGLGWSNEVGGPTITNTVGASTIVLGAETDLMLPTIVPGVPVTIDVAASSNIIYSVIFNSVTGTPKYAVRARVEYLG